MNKDRLEKLVIINKKAKELLNAMNYLSSYEIIENDCKQLYDELKEVIPVLDITIKLANSNSSTKNEDMWWFLKTFNIVEVITMKRYIHSSIENVYGMAVVDTLIGKWGIFFTWKDTSIQQLLLNQRSIRYQFREAILYTS